MTCNHGERFILVRHRNDYLGWGVHDREVHATTFFGEDSEDGYDYAREEAEDALGYLRGAHGAHLEYDLEDYAWDNDASILRRFGGEWIRGVPA